MGCCSRERCFSLFWLHISAKLKSNKSKEMISVMQENKRTVVEDIKTKLLTNIQPKSIILFGSVARGTDSLDSDIDLLVVWDEQKDIPNIKRRIMLRQIIGITESPLDILTCTSDELKIALSDEQSFTSHIIKEGEVLYGGLH